ncbi:MAG: SidA/IucD/PvdA family monooxygenase [Streptosporangiales bacterium]|nr:SidA/IucD/PvdA family monooxygenase [Streptosporangiales bacterium]
MGVQLIKAGIDDFVILEKADDVGGTWRDNTYPGAACDIPSHLYSFSFEKKTDWSRKYPSQQEILDYLRDCARKHGLLGHIRFGVEVTEARFDEADATWRVRTATGEEIAARVLVSACGQLNRPTLPDLLGLADFAGHAFHSARWDHGYDLTGKRVAVVGTGASAVQFIPPVAEQAERLYVFQRSAPYVVDKPDRPYADWERALLRRVPPLYTLSRVWQYLYYEMRVLGFVKYTRLMDLLANRFRRNLVGQVGDTGLQQVLTPDYPMGCKRILLSNDYYPAVRRDNVEMVTEPIEAVEPEQIVTADDRRRPVEAIIFGTGFQSTDFLAPMRVVGTGGRELSEVWQDGAEAYLGITVSGFPNLFLLYGPNTNLGHNSIIYMLESQFRYVLRCIRELRRNGLAYLDVRPDVQNEFNARLQERLRASVWDKGCTSWYKTASGRNTNNWPSYTFAYRRATRRPRLADYHVSQA